MSRPIVTFLSDFGSSDPFVGVCQGVIVRTCPEAEVIHLAHGIEPQSVGQGSRVLAASVPYLPVGVHMAVVDPGVGSERRAICLRSADGRLFVGPDNGLLSLAAPAPRRAWRIENTAYRREPVSPTFHGRDVFAAAAGRLASGWAADGAGGALGEIVSLPVHARPLDAGGEGEVVHIDGFGNLFTSFSGAVAPGPWVVELGEDSFSLTGGRTFTDVAPGELVLYPGSGGQVEIAMRDGSAEALTGAGLGASLRLRRRS